MRPPRVMITDKLASYGAAKKDMMLSVGHRQHMGLNNRAENVLEPTRRRERQLERFKSSRQGSASSRPTTGSITSFTSGATWLPPTSTVQPERVRPKSGQTSRAAPPWLELFLSIVLLHAPAAFSNNNSTVPYRPSVSNRPTTRPGGARVMPFQQKAFARQIRAHEYPSGNKVSHLNRL
ncbi:hypothetical protein [Roseomonas chloroacetimidivorans]|uniref:hypothetical protein n=1 Tax=Roseomonas chloroacetimidivorans TaxID=1766656 RepID=UPI003C75E495